MENGPLDILEKKVDQLVVLLNRYRDENQKLKEINKELQSLVNEKKKPSIRSSTTTRIWMV